MTNTEAAIHAMVDRETRAWNERDAPALADLCHPDMVWPWPPNAGSHDPVTWCAGFGRYDRARWTAEWQELFERPQGRRAPGLERESPGPRRRHTTVS